MQFAIEDFGKPVVLLANKGFVTDAHSAAPGKGMPGICGYTAYSPSYIFPSALRTLSGVSG